MLVVFVVRRVLRLIDDEVLEARAAHREVELAGDGEHRVIDRFGFELAAVHAPEKGVTRVDLLVGRMAEGGLTIGRARDDQSVELLERLAAVAEIDGQPVEQFGVCGQAAHASEVVWRIAQAAAEVVMPDAVDDDAPGERITVIGDPMREGDAPGTFGCVGGQVELRAQLLGKGQGAWADFFVGAAHITTLQHEDRPGLATVGPCTGEGASALVDRAHVSDLRRGEFGNVRGNLGAGGGKFGELLIVRRIRLAGALADLGALAFQEGDAGIVAFRLQAIEVAVGQVEASPAWAGFDAIE